MTKDKAIQRNPLEREALLGSGAKTFVLTAGNLSGIEMAKILGDQLAKIERVARKHEGALIARVTRTEVTIVDYREAPRHRSGGGTEE